MAAPKNTSKGTSKGSKKDEQSAKEKQDAAARKAEQEKAKAEKKAADEAKKQEAAEKARKAKIDAGDLVVTKTHEYEASEKGSKSAERTSSLIEGLKKRKGEPVTVSELADEAGVKYAEDYLTVFLTLEHLGLAKRFEARDTREGAKSVRRSVAYAATKDLLA